MYTNLTDEQIYQYTNDLFNIFVTYLKYGYHEEDLWIAIINFIKLHYSVENGKLYVPPPFLILDYIFSIAEVTEGNDIAKIGHIHKQIINDMSSITDDYNYEPSVVRSINKFKYAILCHGRKHNADDDTSYLNNPKEYYKEMENLIIYDKITSDNTFYIDILPEVDPDSISDLTKKNAVLVYNGKEVPLNHFKIIVTKGCGFGEFIFYTRTVLENLYKYLKKNGTLQIYPANQYTSIEDDISDLFTVVPGEDTLFLFKL